ncbi:DNA polymerase III subunit delta [Alkalihalobacillus oceani]|uniref:DNA polymerase III subunit delta n=1 Tax=Halalkalibacter oceani TaxID=1653776 RepID=UPI00203F790C|nr:DNA polymerase III subunit delta [Halalkalibacter oceani]MCM3761535.1 DNA polymerase III subunit delta [Halalkalibacter oceani]
MSYIKTKKKLEQGNIDRVYFLHGTQTFLIEDITQQIIAKAAVEQENVITYSLVDTPLELAVEEAETFPFFGGKKIVIVQDFFFVTSQKPEGKIEHDLSRLERYLTAPLPESILILITPYEKLDERKKITKALKEHATVVDCAPFDAKMTEEWLEDQAREKGFRFTGRGKEQLVERVGPQLLLLASEIEKLALYVGENGQVDEDVVALLVARSLEQDVFALLDLAVKQQAHEALLLYHDLLKKKEEPLKLLVLIARQLRIYYQVKELTRRAYSQKQMAAQLKLHPYVVKLASQQAGRFEDRQLLTLLKQCADTDFAIKSGKVDKVLGVELLVLKLASASIQHA